MRPTGRLLQQARQPLIRFLGKRSPPTHVDHTPHVHPASPMKSLPDSFASYRQKAQQHGPLNRRDLSAHVGSKPGAALGPVKPGPGEFWDRTELPARFGRLRWTKAEIEAVESGGASLFA
ncbi:hypothetical protein IWX49DRAFT_590664 [Phyllosticta citricarpa]|uniref:Ribosomal protein S36, mitochondrial n=2 Tax=Phyllosticta TaxID=121621 RepID=A0ABR1MQY6_9PEZI